MENDLELISQ